MSAGFQSVSIIGGIGRDPESKSTPNGTKVFSFSVGVDCGFGDNSYTEWFNIVLFGTLAERAEKMKVRKGAKVAITGKLKTRSWDDKQSGEKKYRTELIADSLDYFGDSSKSDKQPAARERSATPPPVRRTETADDVFSDPNGDPSF